MKSKIRKISEQDNILFELMQYKIELDFLFESQNRQLNDKFKKIILSDFRKLTVDFDKKPNTCYLHYKLKIFS